MGGLSTCDVIVACLVQGWCLLVTRHPFANFIGADMLKRSSVVTSCAAVGVVLFSMQAFVPAPQVNRRTQISVVAGSVAALGAAPAFTDEIGDAAR